MGLPHTNVGFKKLIHVATTRITHSASFSTSLGHQPLSTHTPLFQMASNQSLDLRCVLLSDPGTDRCAGGTLESRLCNKKRF